MNELKDIIAEVKRIANEAYRESTDKKDNTYAYPALLRIEAYTADAQRLIATGKIDLDDQKLWENVFKDCVKMLNDLTTTSF